MMPGIEILNSVEITTIPAWAGIIFILSVLICLMFLFIGDADNTAQCLLTILSGCTALAIILILPAISIPNGTKYQVLINEEVNLVEFYENYEIVRQEGKIYTIKERDKD